MDLEGVEPSSQQQDIYNLFNKEPSVQTIITLYKQAIVNNDNTNAKIGYKSLVDALSKIDTVIYDMYNNRALILILEESTQKIYNQLQLDIANAKIVEPNANLYNSIKAENNNIDKALWLMGPGATLKNRKTLNQMGENTRLNGVNTALFIWYWILLLALFSIDFFLLKNTIMSSEWIIKYAILILFPFAIGTLEYILFLIWRKFNNIAFVNPTV